MNIAHIEQVATQYGDFSGWLALAFIIVKEIIIPFAKKLAPAQAKAILRQKEHEKEIEDKKLQIEIDSNRVELEIKKGTLDALKKISDGYLQQTEILRGVVSDVKEIKVDLKEIKQSLPRKKITKV